uniref:Gamma-glutamylcyclotransferase n=1 Tax=Buteo japonicus TaxID=224669 RepID=A0A8C0HN74_9AVES
MRGEYRAGTAWGVDAPSACTWGVAYEVRGEQIAASLQYLNMREAVLGGYDTKLVKFHPQDKDAEEPILALVYIATPQNPSYLGPASEEDIAAQIIVSSGCAGHNIEYLLRLADFMRYFCPQAEDKHLFSIEEEGYQNCSHATVVCSPHSTLHLCLLDFKSVF